MAQRCYFGFMIRGSPLMNLSSDLPQCNILRHQEMHTGTPEYRAYRHQGAVKNCLALSQVLPKLSVMVGFLRDNFLPIVSVSVYCISCHLSYCLPQPILLQVTLAISLAISSLSKLMPRLPSHAGASSAPLATLRAHRHTLCPRMTNLTCLRRGLRDQGLL